MPVNELVIDEVAAEAAAVAEVANVAATVAANVCKTYSISFLLF